MMEVEASGEAESDRRQVGPDEDAEVSLMMGMRLREGLELSRLPVEYLNKINNNINELIALELIYSDGNRLKTTDAGRPILNEVLRRLLVD